MRLDPGPPRVESGGHSYCCDFDELLLNTPSFRSWKLSEKMKSPNVYLQGIKSGFKFPLRWETLWMLRLSTCLTRAVASLSLPGGQDRMISSIFPHFPVASLIFPQFFFIFFLILVFRVAHPGRPWLRHWSYPLQFPTIMYFHNRKAADSKVFLPSMLYFHIKWTNTQSLCYNLSYSKMHRYCRRLVPLMLRIIDVKGWQPHAFSP